jgi:hypothetical protein
MEANKYHWKYSRKNNCQSTGHRYWKCCSAMCNVAKTKTKTLQKLWSEKANQPQAKPENKFPKMQSVVLSDDQELQKPNLTESSQNAATNVSSLNGKVYYARKGYLPLLSVKRERNLYHCMHLDPIDRRLAGLRWQWILAWSKPRCDKKNFSQMQTSLLVQPSCPLLSI